MQNKSPPYCRVSDSVTGQRFPCFCPDVPLPFNSSPLEKQGSFTIYFSKPLIKSQKSLQFSEALSRQTQATEFSWKINPIPPYSPWIKLSSKLKIVFITPETKLCEATRQHLAWKDFSEEKVAFRWVCQAGGTLIIWQTFSQRWLELKSYFWVQFIIPPVKHFSQ